MKFKTGDVVRVVDGPFERFTATVVEVDPDRERVKVSLSILGREGTFELDFSQVEKIP